MLKQMKRRRGEKEKEEINTYKERAKIKGKEGKSRVRQVDSKFAIIFMVPAEFIS